MLTAEKQLIDVGDREVASIDDLFTIIKVNGGLFFKPRETPQDAKHKTLSLSSREIEVLKLVASGDSNKRIANLFKISEHTVKNHLTSIMQKLNANSRTHAVIIALRQGWLSI